MVNLGVFSLASSSIFLSILSSSLSVSGFLVPIQQLGRVSSNSRIASSKPNPFHPSSTIKSLEEAPAATATATRIEDANVPEAHKGLHEFLYGDDEDHGASGKGADVMTTFTRDQNHSVFSWLEKYGGPSARSIAAVYGVHDSKGVLQYIGVSRNVALSLTSHVKAKGGDVVASVSMQLFKYPKREEMAAYEEAWLQELSDVPPGNQGAGWAATIKEALQATSSPEQLAGYEETKVKLRTAMADPTLADELDELDDLNEEYEDSEESAAIRRAQLRKAVEGDDWSGVIDAQTRATIKPKKEDASVAAAEREGDIVSPFTAGSEGDKGTKVLSYAEDEVLELTPDNVDKVLDEVRPYLISDGGNIEVVRIDVEARDVFLRLQGACGSCPSSTTTMKMGVERVLKEKFADLGRIEAISDLPLNTDGEPLTEHEALRQKVEGKLDEILPAIRGLGASAVVEDVTSTGEVTLSFKGPDKVKLGIVYAIKGMQGVTDVRVV